MPFLVPDKPFPCCLAPPFPLVAWRLIPLSPIHNPRFSPKIQENRPRGKKNRQNAWPYQKHSVSLHPLRPLYSILGEMAEWSNAPVLKTGVLQGTGGSNPSLSAVESCKSKDLQDFFLFVLLSSPPLGSPDKLWGQSENSVVILLSGYSFVSLRHETMASITDSIS